MRAGAGVLPAPTSAIHSPGAWAARSAALGPEGRHLRPAGSACRAPPTYRNRLRAAGWSPRTGNTSESRPSSDTCSQNVPRRRRKN